MSCLGENNLKNICKEPLALLDGFEWVEFDLNNDQHLTEIYTFLTENYVESDDGMFRFDYSKDFLKWSLAPPGYYKDLICGVKVIKSNKLVGFITGIPMDVVINKKEIKMVEINFLCVHKKLRLKRLAPTLIKEITRRTNLHNIWQAIYTAGANIKLPITRAYYYHRSLNPKKLIDIGFSYLPPNQTIPQIVKLNKLPDTPPIKNIRLFKSTDAEQVTNLIMNYLSTFSVHFKFTQDEIKYWLLPKTDIIYSYVVENNNKITDFISFFCLSSTIFGQSKYKQLKVAYSYYNVATTVSLTELIHSALIIAVNEGFDVYNALDIFNNQEIFEKLKFQRGNGSLNYYFQNIELENILDPSAIGVVLH